MGCDEQNSKCLLTYTEAVELLSKSGEKSRVSRRRRGADRKPNIERALFDR